MVPGDVQREAQASKADERRPVDPFGDRIMGLGLALDIGGEIPTGLDQSGVTLGRADRHLQRRRVAVRHKQLLVQVERLRDRPAGAIAKGHRRTALKVSNAAILVFTPEP
jgi:hypothetical protein